MKQPLDFVLLIDDDEDDNFFHRRIIHKAKITNNILCFESGQEALTYLQSLKTPNNKQATFIFLDLNMPLINGWKFLEAYKGLEFPEKEQVKIFLLTTSLNPVDVSRAEANPLVQGFLPKPLNSSKLTELIETHL